MRWRINDSGSHLAEIGISPRIVVLSVYPLENGKWMAEVRGLTPRPYEALVATPEAGRAECAWWVRRCMARLLSDLDRLEPEPPVVGYENG